MVKELTQLQKDHKFNPRDENEKIIVEAIENASEILCGALDVNVTLRIERQAGWAGSNAFHAGAWLPIQKMVKINMRNLYGASLKQIIEVLGHEFRHAVQTIHNMMDADIPDTAYSHKWRASYYNRPEEKDARKYQKVYADIVTQHKLFKYKERLGETVSGEPLRIPDHDASIDKLGIPKERMQLFRDFDGSIFWFDLSDVNGHPKRWTKSIAQKVWLNQAEQLRKQKFETLYRDITIDDLVS